MIPMPWWGWPVLAGVAWILAVVGTVLGVGFALSMVAEALIARWTGRRRRRFGAVWGCRDGAEETENGNT